MSVPKIIWTYWHSVSDMPEFVQKCISSWYLHNPDYVINVIEYKTISKFVGYQEAYKIKHWKFIDSVQRVSDLVRLSVLSKYGGIWLDASCVMYENLNWVNEFSDDKNVIMYYIPSVSKKHGRPVPESWFIACTRENEYIKKVKNEFFGVENIKEYVSKLDIKDLEFDFEYLLIYLVLKKVLEEEGNLNKKIKLLDAYEGPYLYHKTGGIKSICEINNKPKFFKFRKNERNEMTKEIENCIFLY